MTEATTGTTSETDPLDEENPAIEAAEVASERKPETMPNVWPFHALPRRHEGRSPRADATRALRKALASSQRFSQLNQEAMRAQTERAMGDAAGGKLTADVLEVTDLAADLQDVLVDVIEFLVSVAADSPAMERWCNEVTDQDLLAGWRWYQRTFPVGEALRSQG